MVTAKVTKYMTRGLLSELIANLEGTWAPIRSGAPAVNIQRARNKTGPFSSFNVCLEAGFQGSRVPSDGGLLLERELDERLGFGELIRDDKVFAVGTNAKKVAGRHSEYILGWPGKQHENFG
jgi:hypothetical protein